MHLDWPAEAEAVVVRVLNIGAEFEHVLAMPVARQRQRFDPLEARDVAFLIVEESAGLRLRRVRHVHRILGVDVDLELAERNRRLEYGIRPERESVDITGGQPALVELRRRLHGPEGVQRRMTHLARKQDQAAAERVTRRRDDIETREGVEAVEFHFGLVRQTLHRRGDVAKLEVLREEDLVLLERTVEAEARLESADGLEAGP